MTRIREATRDDLAGVRRLALNFIRGTNYRTVPELEAAFGDATIEHALTHGVIFVGTDASADDPHDRRAGEERLVGMIAGAWEPTNTGGALVSELVWWVEPAYRKTRLGPNLLRCLEDWTRQKGCHVLKMVAPAESPDHCPVATYYKRLGYTPIETAFIKRL